jgi:hypothetical protein
MRYARPRSPVVKIMAGRQWVALAAALGLCLSLAVPGRAQEESELIFAVVTNIPKDRRHVTAHVLTGGQAQTVTLTPSEAISDHPIWKKLEICHSLRLMGVKTGDGYLVKSLKHLDAGMLPMALQGIAGDCLTKKALEYAPSID